MKNEDRIRNNVENGIQCPQCGSYDVDDVTALTGRVDAGTMRDIYGCRECGYMDSLGFIFSAAQAAGNEAHALADSPEAAHDAYRATFDAAMAKEEGEQ